MAWQCETIGPLRTTSAFLFESANHFLIKPVTGTVNTCKLLVQRYIRNREISASELAIDLLNSFIRNLVGSEKRIKDDHGLLRSNFTKELSEQFPSARIFCRFRYAFLLDSNARGSARDSNAMPGVLQMVLLKLKQHRIHSDKFWLFMIMDQSIAWLKFNSCRSHNY